LETITPKDKTNKEKSIGNFREEPPKTYGGLFFSHLD